MLRGETPKECRSGKTTPSGSERSAKSRCSGSTCWWLRARACRSASARASLDFSVSLLMSMGSPRQRARIAAARGSFPRQRPDAGEWHEVASVATPDPIGFLAKLAAGQLGLPFHIVHLPANPLQLGLELDHHLHSGEIDPPLGKPLDGSQPLDVTVRIPAGVPGRPGRAQQSLPLVDAKGLRMDPGQLGRDADDVHPPVAAALPRARHACHLARSRFRSRGGGSRYALPGIAPGSPAPAWTDVWAPPRSPSPAGLLALRPASPLRGRAAGRSCRRRSPGGSAGLPSRSMWAP